MAGAVTAERVPGTKVNLTPPDNFTSSRQFPGFVMKESNASIMVTRLPGPYSKVTMGFTKQGLSTKGMKLIEKKDIKLGTDDAILLHVSQKAYGTEYLKWMAALGDETETLLIVATFPKSFESTLSGPLKTSVLSARWNKNAQTDFFEGLTFRVSGDGGLEIATKIGNNIILAPGGSIPSKSKDDPVAIMGASVTEDYIISDKKAFSLKRLKKSEYIKDIEILKEEDTVIDGLSGRRILAKATDVRTGKQRFVYHTLFYTTDGYYIFQGFSAFDEKNKYQLIFQSILQSFKRK